MQYLNINVEQTDSNCSITYLFNEPAFSLPLPLKRAVAAALWRESEMITNCADMQVQLDWELELEQLQAEQARDLATPVLTWWEHKPLTEAGYFNQLAQVYGKTEVFYG